MNDLLACQVVVGRLATRQDLAVIQERHLGTRTAAAVLAADHGTSLAWDIVARSVERQARIAGVGRVDLGTRPDASTATRWEVAA